MRRLGPALGERDFALLWLALVATGVSQQMLQVAIGWQVYSIHHSAFLLGLIGLAEFVPMFLLALPAGQLADRLPRRLVFGGSLVLASAVAAGLCLISSAGVTSIVPFLALAFASGVATALGTPALRAMPPTLVGPELLANAMTLRAIGVQAAAVSGPALGGALYPASPAVVYGTATAMSIAGLACIVAMRSGGRGDVASEDEQPSAASAKRAAPGLASVLAGIGFIRRTPILLGAILLDLFAVLFGGAVALLPVFASSILHTGPFGLGILRSAPAIGALVAAGYLTWRPLGQRAGRTLLIAVATFGVSMIVFGLSRSVVLSFAALAASGFADLFSVNIRSTTVALATPDELRGRVLAVEMVFISASNQLGAFESGVAAALLGAVPAVVVGGAITIVLAVGWSRLFPSLALVDRMEDVRPAEPSLVPG